jgi:alanine racemase
VGDEVVLFGDAAAGAPPVEDWAAACDTINWEIVTRIGGRVVRRYVGE